MPDAIVPRALAGVRRAATAGWIRMSGKQAAWSHEFGAGASDDATGAVEAVEAAVRVLEDDPSFNAGRGSSLTTTGIVQCDASVCCGHRLSAGAVCGISIARNPVSVARLVMESTKHVLLCGEGANAFAKHIGADLVEHGALVTPEARQRLAAARERTSLASFLRENRLVYGRVLPGAAHPSALPAGHVAGSELEQAGGSSLKQPAAAAGQVPMEATGTDHSGGENGVGSIQADGDAGAAAGQDLAEGEGGVHAHNQSTARMAATVAAAAAVSAIQEAAPIAGKQSPPQGDGTATGMPPPPTAGQGQGQQDALGMSAAEEQTAVVAAVAAATSAVAGATEGMNGPGGLSISATHASSSSSSSSSSAAAEFPPTDADADGIGMISVNDSLESYEEEAQLAEAQLRSGYGHRTTMHQRRRRRTADRVLGQGRRTTARRRAAAAQQQVARVAAAAATAAVRAVASHRRRVQRNRGSATSATETTGQSKGKAGHSQSKGTRAASNGRSSKAKLPAKRARRASSKDSSKSPAADAAAVTPGNPPKKARTIKTNGSAGAAHEEQPKKDAAGVMYADALKAGVAEIDGPGDGACTDTVGAVALDLQGHVASATSTGGITNKLLGRVGDSPLVGAGGFADDWSGAVSATGFGEAIMRVSLARRVAEGMEAGRCGWRVPREAEAGKPRAGAQDQNHRDDDYPWERDSDSESEAPQPGSMAQFEARLAKGRGKAGARAKGKGKATGAEGGSGVAGHVEPTVGTPTVSSQAGDSDGVDGDGNDRGDASESSSAWTDDLSAGMDAAHPRRAIRRALGYLLHRVRGASGVIALDRNGRWAVGHSTRRIAWAAVTPDGVLYSGISAADDQALPPPDPVQPVELKLALRGRGRAGEQEQLID